MAKFFHHIGIEIEGAWDDLSVVLPWYKLDGSVSVDGYVSTYNHPLYDRASGSHRIWREIPIHEQETLITSYKNKAHSGEIASDPFNLYGHIKKWVEMCQPKAVNRTCGMHIHISFHDIESYAKLMTLNFHEQLFNELQIWSNLNKNLTGDDKELLNQRLAGRNSYAERGFRPITRNDYGRKYSGMNYSSFIPRGRMTFECRIMPAFSNKELTLGGIRKFWSIVRTFLSEQKVSDDVILENTDILMQHVPEPRRESLVKKVKNNLVKK